MVKYLILLNISIVFACSCKSDFSKAKQQETFFIKADTHFMEEICYTKGASRTDTLWHFKYDLDSDNGSFNKIPGLKIGLDVVKTNQEPGSVYNIIYASVQENQLDNIMHRDSSGTGVHLKSFVGNILNQQVGADMQFVKNKDRYVAVVDNFSAAERIKTIMAYFSEDLKKVTKGNNCINYRIILSDGEGVKISEFEYCL